MTTGSGAAELLGEHVRLLPSATPTVLLQQSELPDGRPTATTFATSAPGAIALATGRSPGVRIRVQRWSTRPSLPDGPWTDRDELPWQALSNAGPLGIDDGDPGSLDVAGLGRCRAVVLASQGTLPDEPNEWLVQLFPDPERHDAMAGPPRILSVDPFDVASPPATESSDTSGFRQAMARLATTGWRCVRYAGVDLLLPLLDMYGGPVTVAQLQSGVAQMAGLWPVSSWEDALVPAPKGPHLLDRFGEDVDSLVAALADAAGMTSLRSLPDTLECLIRLGALVTVTADDGVERIAPNPAAPSIWDCVALPPGWRLTVRADAMQRWPVTPHDDLAHLLRWAEGGTLRATLRQVGERLAVRPDDVRAQLAFMSLGEITTERNLATIDEDTPIDATQSRWRPPTEVAPTRLQVLDHETLVALLEEFLAADQTAAWLAHERPSARLVPTGPGQRPTVVLGGSPQLPDDVDWPTWDGRPLTFLATLDLAAVHEVLPDAPLPSDGQLHFFVVDDPVSIPGAPPLVGALFPASRPGWRVLHVPEGEPTVERRPPVSAVGEQPYEYRRVERVLVPEVTLPAPYSFRRGREIAFDAKQLDALQQARWERRHPRYRVTHRVGGWPDPTQADPATPVALAASGLVDERGQLAHGHPEAAKLAAAADDDWFLLLQLDGDDEAGWMWGDGGVMFFYVRPDDARRGDFSEVWMNWDCH